MRAFTVQQRNYEDIHPGFTPFNQSPTAEHSSQEFDPDYIIIMLLVALILLDSEESIKLF